MTTTTNTTLGELISVLYDEFLAVYNDEELASVAVAATINDLLTDGLDDNAGQLSVEADGAAA